MGTEKNITQEPEKERIHRLVIWLPPSEIQRIDAWLAADNCKNRSEFISKALRFYMGYLSTEDTSEYLSKVLVSTLRGIIEDNANRFRSLIFKMCVEVGMAVHVVAAHFKADRIDLSELRGYVVGEVKRTNGQVSFDDALRQQRQLPSGDEWQE